MQGMYAILYFLYCSDCYLIVTAFFFFSIVIIIEICKAVTVLSGSGVLCQRSSLNIFFHWSRMSQSIFSITVCMAEEERRLNFIS